MAKASARTEDLPQQQEEQTTSFRDRVGGGTKTGPDERAQVRSGDVVATLFPHKTPDGKTYDTVTLQKKYTDAEGKDAYGNSFDRRDMLDISRAANKALDRMEERSKERYNAQNR